MLASKVRSFAAAVTVTGLLVTLAAPGVAEAQAQAPPAEPIRWQGSVNASVSIQSGVSDTRSYSLGADAFRRNPGAWSVSIQADHNHASFKIGPDFTTVADSQNVRFTAERDLNEVLYFVLRPAYKRNEIQGVEYRFEGLAGLGARLLRQPRAQFDVLGVGGFVNQDKNVEAVNGASGVGGVVQTAMFVITPTWRAQEMALYLKPFDNDDYRMQFQVALNGQIVGPIGLNLSYSMDRENIVIGSSEKTDRRLTVGLSVNW